MRVKPVHALGFPIWSANSCFGD